MARSKKARQARSKSSALSGAGRWIQFAWVLAGATLIVPPFLVFESLHDPFRLPKLLASEWLGLACLLLLVVAWWRGGSEFGAKELRRLFEQPSLRIALPLLAVAGLGLFTSTHPQHTQRALWSLAVGLAVLVGWSLGFDRARLRRLLTLTVVPAIPLGALALLQYYDFYRPFDFLFGQREDAARMGVTALAGNTGELAAFLVLPSLVAQWRLAGSGPGWGVARIGWAVGLAVMIYAMALTQTLAALLALILGSAVLWLWILPRRRAVTVLIVVGIIVAGLIVFSPVGDRLTRSGEQLASGGVNDVLSGRLDGWRAALWMAEQQPVVGIGHGAYRAEFSDAKLSLLAEGTRFYRGHQHAFFSNAHNEFLEVLAEWGLLGVIGLAWCLFVLWRRLRRLARSTGDGQESDPHLPAFAWAVTASLAVLAISHFPFRVALVAYPYLAYLAWLLAEGRAEEAS